MPTISVDKKGVWFVEGACKTQYSEAQVNLKIAYYEGQLAVLREYQRLLTKRAADSPKAGGKSAKRKVVKAKVIRPAKSG